MRPDFIMKEHSAFNRTVPGCEAGNKTLSFLDSVSIYLFWMQGLSERYPFCLQMVFCRRVGQCISVQIALYNVVFLEL